MRSLIAPPLPPGGYTNPSLSMPDAFSPKPGSAEGLTPTGQEDTHPAIPAAAGTSAAPDSVLGPYRLLRLVGEGGMGEVWLAEQQQPVRRFVALKLIKAGMDTREVVARFEYERQALASLDHPAIAKVFDAGSSVLGRPYFVMEYVTGTPITTYCDEHRLNTRERLELFVQVCEGVQHAHQRAILHRDLKPSNILVTEVDGRPTPKIIDFGVAKAISQGLADGNSFTRVGALIGTPEYMSPEQALSAGEDIDTRSDVYSLGVVLYELLVGVLPLQLSTLPLDELLRALREQDSAKPSTKVRVTPQPSASATHRGTDTATLRKELRGDLDAITLKALAKEPARRYASATEFAADIRRYLHNEPVAARPGSVAYRTGKYVRRHRITIAVAASLILLLAAFTVAQALQLRRTKRERDRADRITAFMTRMFKVSNPSESRGSQITAREILDKASSEIDTGLANDPELRAQMQQVMGTVYWNLGLYSRAEPLLRKALNSRSRRFGDQNADTAESMNTLARLYMDEGHYADAERLHRQTLEIRRKILGPDHLETLTSMSGLANALGAQGHYAESERLQREAFEGLRQKLGPEHIETLRAMNNLATTMNLESHFPQAAELHREALAIERRVYGPENVETLRSMNNLASDLGNLGQLAEADKLDGEALRIERRVLGPEHPDTLRSMSALANDLALLGRYEEAEKQLRETLELQRRVLGENHPDTAITTYELALIAAKRGRTAEALSLLRQSLQRGLDATTIATMSEEPELKPLHGNPQFEALLKEAQGRLPRR
jgi:eukaryotic-like serine/threonine-protein kinase